MAVQVSYPGVYIEEFAPGAPIQGVGTSTAAFIGIAASGDINEPVKVTSWDRFKQLYGAQPVTGFYLWYAVRGFFENGGQVCYVVRASDGSYQELTLNDRTDPVNPKGGRPVVLLRARQPGAQGITVEVSNAPFLKNVAIYRPDGKVAVRAPKGARAVTLDVDGVTSASNVAGRFRPGDEVAFDALTETYTVVGVAGPTIRLGGDLADEVAAGVSMFLANTAVGARTIRLRPPTVLGPGQLVRGTILRVTQGTSSDTQVVESVHAEVLSEGPHGAFGPNSYRVTFRSGLAIQLDLKPTGTDKPVADSNELDLVVKLGAVAVPYARLSMDPAHPQYLVRMLNDDSSGLLMARLLEPPPPNPLAISLPRPGPALVKAAGAKEQLSKLTAEPFKAAIDVLRDVDDVNFVAVPDRPHNAAATKPITENAAMLEVQQALIAHCEQLADRFAVLDSDPGAELFVSSQSPSVEQQRRGLDSMRGYAALYYPWLRTTPEGGDAPIPVPPSGHVCGIFARSDLARGVHKAPANETVNGAVGVERRMSLSDQGQLNPQGINVIQVFQGGGRPVLWGARTTATDRNWQYVNVRRLFLYLEESIQEGIRWAVFEPNNLQLWQKLRRTIGEFLDRAWRDGALFGAKAEDAYYVRIDEALNPFSEQALGRLNIEIGVRPAYPAEFIIVRIGIWDGGAEARES